MPLVFSVELVLKKNTSLSRQLCRFVHASPTYSNSRESYSLPLLLVLLQIIVVNV